MRVQVCVCACVCVFFEREQVRDYECVLTRGSAKAPRDHNTLLSYTVVVVETWDGTGLQLPGR